MIADTNRTLGANQSAPAAPLPATTAPAWLRWATVGLVAVVLAAGFAFATLDFDSSVKRLIESRADLSNSISLTAEMQGQANPYSAASYVVMGGAGLLVLMAAPLPGGVFRPLPVMLVLGYAGLALSSALWSADVSLTVRRAVALGLMITAALGVTRLVTLRQLAWIVAGIGVVYALAGVAAEQHHGLFTPWARAYRLSGVQHPNGQAMLSALGLLACFVFFPRSGRWRAVVVAVALFSLVVLVMTKSRTSAAALLLAVGLAQSLRGGARGLAACAVVGATVVGLSLVFIGLQGQRGVGAASSTVAMGRGEHVGSLTGRLPLWGQLLSLSSDHVVQGAGYGAFWNAKTTERISYTQGWNVSHAHSIYLQAYLELGVPGVSLLLAVLACLLLYTLGDYYRTGSLEALYTVAIAVLAIVHGLAEVSFVSRGLPFFTLIAAMGYLAHASASRAPVLVAGRQA